MTLFSEKGTYAALAKDKSSVPSTLAGWLTIDCNSSSRDLVFSSTCIYMLIHIIKNKIRHLARIQNSVLISYHQRSIF